MTEDRKSGRELLEDMLRDTAEDERQTHDVRMRAALALAELEGNLSEQEASRLLKIINGSND